MVLVRIAIFVTVVYFGIIFGVFEDLNGLTSHGKRHKLLLVSFDGLRWDYLERYKCPNFMYLAKTGVWASRGIKPAFVSKTFPNHYSIATGLYEESHGIVDNDMYDPLYNETFRMGNIDSKWWNAGEPIWVTGKRQGLKTASYFWAGSEAVIKGTLPDITVKYNKSVPFEVRVDTVVNWLAYEDVDLAVAYFHEPDSTGHKSGTFNEKLESTVHYVDAILGRLLDKLQENLLLETTNLIVLSDHGMTNITLDDEHVISVEKYVDFDRYIKMMPQTGPVAGILPYAGEEETVYRLLKGAHPNMTVYRKEDIPERFHYKNHRRIMPIIAVADEGYYINDRWPPNFSSISIGQHGYDNEIPSMRPIFLARGPNFKKNHTAGVFPNVDVYPLMCHLLGIQAAPNNGSLDLVQDFLVKNSPNFPVDV